MRIGVFGLTPPAEVAPDSSLEWVIGEAAALNVQVVGGDHRPTFRWGSFRCDRGYWRHLRELAASKGMAIEPFVRSPFDLVGPGARDARSAVLDSIRAAAELGGPVMRTAYGDQTLARTRFGGTPLVEHLRAVEANLHEAAKLAESEGVVLAVENHTDFSGREWESVFANVDCGRIACAFDSGNGLTIFADPLEDARALARWSVTTHIKDMRVLQNPRPATGFAPCVPFGLTGCAIGEGNVAIEAVVRLLLDQSISGPDIPLIVEPSWPQIGPDDDLAQKRNELAIVNVRNLKSIVAGL